MLKVKKLKHYSFSMLASKTNITEDKIVLRYEKSGDKLGLLLFFKQCSVNKSLKLRVFF